MGKKLGIGCLGIFGILIIIGIIAAATSGGKGSTQAATANVSTSQVAPSSQASTSLTASSTAKTTQASSTPSRPVNTPVPTKAAPSLIPIGKAVSVKNWDLTVTAIEKPGKVLTWSEYKNTSNAVGTWLVIALDLKNTGKQNFGVNSFDFKLTDESGAKYDTSTDMGALSYSTYKGGLAVDGAQVPPGVDAKLYLVYDVSPTAKGLHLQFTQDTKPIFDLGQ